MFVTYNHTYTQVHAIHSTTTLCAGYALGAGHDVTLITLATLLISDVTVELCLRVDTGGGATGHGSAVVTVGTARERCKMSQERNCMVCLHDMMLCTYAQALGEILFVLS